MFAEGFVGYRGVASTGGEPLFSGLTDFEELYSRFVLRKGRLLVQFSAIFRYGSTAVLFGHFDAEFEICGRWRIFFCLREILVTECRVWRCVGEG